MSVSRCLLPALLAWSFSLAAQAAPPSVVGVVNSYYKGSGEVAIGATHISYAGSSSGAGHPLAAGDTLLLIQSQGATLNTTNTDQYGDGVGHGASPDGVATTNDHSDSSYAGGLLSQTAGTFEYVKVASVSSTGFTITLQAGTQHAYHDADEANWQIVWVPDYGSDGVTLSGEVKAAPWDGDKGGVVAFNATGGSIDFNSQTVSAAAMGFRGGVDGDIGSNQDDVSSVAATLFDDASDNGGKGEGVAGTPAHVWNGSYSIGGVSTLKDGLDYGRGAPANAGGGAGPHNAGGGGGANAGKGGKGAQGWTGSPGQPGGTSFDYAGYGGQSISAGANMGGGGGSGEANNGGIVHGGAGGGVILLRAASATGAGTVDAAGGAGVFNSTATNGDGAGGGGAGGSVIIYFTDSHVALNGLTVDVRGGAGGDAPTDVGGGGGGGGGYLLSNASFGSISKNGGAAGAGSGGAASAAGGRGKSLLDAHAVLTQLDYGDAPSSYDTNAGVADPARHQFADQNLDGVIGADERLTLGALVDADTSNHPGADAQGDDTSGSDDEDGIATPLPTIDNKATSYVIPASKITLTNGLGAPATLHAWIDFNNNGVFDVGEHTSISIPAGLTNAHPATDLEWQATPGLADVALHTRLYARFRLTTDAGITASTPNGMADDGEVEDYTLEVNTPPQPSQHPQGEVQTGTGAGSLSWPGLGLLGLLALRRRQRRRQLALLSLALLCVPLTLRASPIEPVRLYAGAGLDMTRLAPGTDKSSWELADTSSAGWQVNLGYRLLNGLSVEAFYSDLGKARLHDSVSGIDGQLAYKAMGAAANWYPLQQSWSGEGDWHWFVQMGMASMRHASDEVKFEEGAAVQPSIGAGVDYELPSRWQLRLAVQSFGVDANRIGLSLNKALHFGWRSASNASPSEADIAGEQEASSVAALDANGHDSDADGTPDSRDRCPGTPAGYIVNADGCLALDANLKGVHFVSGSARLSESSKPVLDKLVVSLNHFPSTRVEIGAYTDSLGSNRTNQQLSEKRALAVKHYLVQKGIDPGRLEAKGYGEANPVADNATAAGRKQNRRVELRLLVK